MTAVFGETRSSKPTQKNGYTQIKAFNGKSRWAISDMVPSRIFFDTRTEPGKNYEHHHNVGDQMFRQAPGKASPAPCGVTFCAGGFCHGAINQERRKLLGTFVEIRICFFQPVRIVTFERASTS